MSKIPSECIEGDINLHPISRRKSSSSSIAISKLQLERVLCKHMRFSCFTDGIHLKHLCNCFALSGMCLNTHEKETKSPRGFCPLFHMRQKGSSPKINVNNYIFQSCPFPDVRHLYPGASHP